MFHFLKLDVDTTPVKKKTQKIEQQKKNSLKTIARFNYGSHAIVNAGVDLDWFYVAFLFGFDIEEKAPRSMPLFKSFSFLLLLQLQAV